MGLARLEIIGTGSYLPDYVVRNNYFTGRELKAYDSLGEVTEKKILGEEDIIRLGGIRERRRARDEDLPSDLGYRAAEKAIENAGISVDSLVGVIFATVTEDKNVPSGATKIQKMLGARNCFAYDVCAACAGFPEALAQANARVLRNPGNYLVVASECLMRVQGYDDMNSWIFGDGAGAAVLAPSDEGGILSTYSHSDPFDGKDEWIFRDEDRLIRMPHGRRVMREAVNKMLEAASIVKKEAGWSRADVYIPHQASSRIIQKVRENVQAEGSIVYENVERYGNMAAATCPIALDEAIRDGVVKKGSKVVMVAFGSGLYTSAAAIQF